MERYADVIDLAQAHVEQETALRIAQIRRHAVVMGTGSSRCVDCGGAIPEARRQQVPGARRCVACQSLVERAG
ncbi:MAG: TraR/DksA family transcriptional regulator [Chromatiaceae bacterium]|jgi:phage/conjugal plasmid C-4 type zinc finger TraR family protein|nr:TraR/DksA family transcriptional regulator [Chromatiaceae bacterium]